MYSNYLCGLIPPKRPAKSTPAPEKKPLPTRQFETTLKDIKRNYKTPIPPIMEVCITQLSTPESLSTPHLFKTSIPLDRISKLEDAADHNKDLVFQSPHEAAVLLKVFLRDLKHPLFPEELYKKIVEFRKIDKYAQMHAMHQLIRACPDENIRAIRELIRLLSLVAENAEVNKMDAEALSKMFGQGMFIRNANGVVTVADIIHVNSFIEYMIINCNGIFT